MNNPKTRIIIIKTVHDTIEKLEDGWMLYESHTHPSVWLTKGKKTIGLYIEVFQELTRRHLIYSTGFKFPIEEYARDKIGGTK